VNYHKNGIVGYRTFFNGQISDISFTQ